MSDQPIEPTTAEAGQNFVSFVINSILNDPRTKAQIGSFVRWALHAIGTILGTVGMASMSGIIKGLSSNADLILVVSGVALSVAQLVWGLYQKWCVDRKIVYLKEIAAVSENR